MNICLSLKISAAAEVDVLKVQCPRGSRDCSETGKVSDSTFKYYFPRQNMPAKVSFTETQEQICLNCCWWGDA